MPYFINVGVFKGLKSGLGARGWHVWRQKKTIHVHFGPIHVSDRYPKRLTWAAGPTKEKFSKSSGGRLFEGVDHISPVAERTRS
jgi:hypothetical protein